MTELYDALENCLEAMERGASVENALKRYPQLAAELRPLLAASVMARNSSRVHVPLEIRQRGRNRMQQRLREMEKQQAAPRRRIIPAFPRLAFTAILAAVLLLTSTGLVSASSASLPGEQLYPVKRTWESVRLLFVFNQQQRDLMQSGYDQERVDEIYELLGRHQAAPISFSGVLAQRSDGEWLVSGIPVSVTTSTTLPSAAIANGVPLTVDGATRADGVVEAHDIQVLQPGSALPPLEPSENEQENPGQPEEGESTAVPLPSPTPRASQAPSGGSGSSQSSYQYTGVIQSMQGNVWVINGQVVHVDAAQVSGQVTVGSIVQFRGYYGPDGSFMVTTVEPQSSAPETKRDSSSTESSRDATEQPSGGGTEPSDGGGEGH